ncbi:MAG: tRNA (N(6)-L-threonylcarbamoyladenosine(37)-C(2))-methylthiotransferase MtaB [Candidatus Eisenbacteria bacterium]|nr:tRNA (N(6)-L-threonylcarbamoyladenosine(37)-C(2))-methylthiotransferase MtaB [Candidatus Eisenbacteria bacterium]
MRPLRRRVRLPDPMTGVSGPGEAGGARVSLHTIGCRLNQAETALLADRFRARGWRVVGRNDPADLFVVNTCSVTLGSEGKCRRLIRFLRKRCPEARVAATGCYAELDPEALLAIDGVVVAVGTADKARLPELAERALAGAPPAAVRSPIEREPFTEEGAGLSLSTRANLKIQDGCDVFCSFCVIPYARGRSRSRRAGDCLREARDLAARGHREIVLSGVNLGLYRDDGADLAGLIERLEEIPGLERIRISSIEPMSVSPALVARMSCSEKLCPYVHVVLQSGDDGVLRAMNRPYGAGDFRRLLETFLARVPDLGIGTDVLVGFPGETDAAFRRTLAILEDYPFVNVHVFAYSEHARTRSARLDEKVHPETIRRRSEDARALGRAKRRAFHGRYRGERLETLFETRDRAGRWIGHAPNYARVAARDDRDLANRIVAVRIDSSERDGAIGTAEGDLR